MNHFVDRLSKRQKFALYSGGGAFLVLLVFQFLFFPFIDARKSINKAIKSNEKTLGEMKLLAAEYRELKQHADKVQQVLARRPQDFTLFSHLEKISSQAGVKSNIKYINAGKGVISGPYEELPVEIKLEKITLKQMTDFLYLLESPQDLIGIKNINISKMKENPDYLALQMQVVTFQITKAVGR